MPSVTARDSIQAVMDEGRLANRPRCDHCGDAIGVYEPLIVRSGSNARETSLAAEPDLVKSDASLLHRVCYELVEIEGQNG